MRIASMRPCESSPVHLRANSDLNLEGRCSIQLNYGRNQINRSNYTSLRTSMRGSDTHPPSSDVDVFIFVDAEVPSEILEPHGRLAPRKLLFRSVVLEPSFHEARRIPDPEAVRG